MRSSDTATAVRRTRDWEASWRAHKRRPHKDHHIADFDDLVHRLADKASMTVVGPGLLKADFAGNCEMSKFASITGRRFTDVIDDHRATASHLDIRVACRRCPRCLASRAASWKRRAREEFRRAGRVWFGTLTLNEASRYQLKAEAASFEASQGLVFEALSPERQFDLYCAQLNTRVTKYLKRVRKASGVGIRFISVIEKHKTGDPHLHMLVYEPFHNVKVTKRVLEANWASIGFTKWRLAKPCAINYVCKYLTKEAQARVRASIRFGDTKMSSSDIAQAVAGRESMTPILSLLPDLSASGMSE